MTCALKTTVVLTSIRAAFYASSVVDASVNKPVLKCSNSAGQPLLPKLADVCVWKPPSRYCHPSWCSSHRSAIARTQFCKRCYMTEEEILKDPDCDVTELKQKFDSRNVYVVDVRNPNELEETGLIPGAVNIPLDIFEQALKLDDASFEGQYGVRKPDLDGSNMVINCRSGKRSLDALRIARNLGYHRSRHLPGGFLLWKEKFEDSVARIYL